MRRLITRLVLAVGMMAGVLGAVAVSEVAENVPAGAVVTHELRYTVASQNYLYDLQFHHHSNGVNTVNVYRFTLDGQYYIAHDLSIQAYDYVCFMPYQWHPTLEVSIHVWANAATDGPHGTSNPCTFPWNTVDPNNCLSYHVYTRWGTYYQYSPSYNQCPYSGYGNHAYNGNVLLEETYPFVYEGATDTRADEFRFRT